MEKVVQRNKLLRILAIDTALVTIAIVLPIISHAIGVELRFMEPMRLTLFAAVLFVPERKNAYLLSFILPWLSCALIGMPVWWKAAMMSFELLANIFILYSLLDWGVKPLLSAFISILLSKAVYYLAKYLLIQTAVLPAVPLFGNVSAIFISAIILSVLFFAGSKILNGKWER